jgi:signal transduction histidine kinase
MRELIDKTSHVLFGLRFRLLLLVLLVCAPLVVLTLHNASEERRRAVAAWRDRAQKMTRLAGREEADMAGQTRQMLLAVSEGSALRSGDRETCKKSLDKVFASYPGFANLGVTDTNGDVLTSAVPLAELGSQADRKFFLRVLATRAFAIGDYSVDSTNGKPAVAFGFPVFDGSNHVQAVVFATIELDWLGGARSELSAQVPKGATWTEIDRNGTIRVRLPVAGLSCGQPFPDRALVKTVVSQQNGIVDGPDSAGIPSFCAFAWRDSQLVPGRVATMLSMPRHILFAGANRALLRSLMWLGAVVGLALSLGWAGSNLLVMRPVEALVRASARLASGDLSTRTGLRHGKDELGQLTRTFDHMAQALEERELERKLAEETLQTRDDKLQRLSRRLVESQETERRHIARELHDEVGQTLTVAEMNLQALVQSSRATPRTGRLQETLQAVVRVLEQVRDLSLNLRPSMLDDLGLEPALRWYTNRQASLAGIQAEFRADAMENRLDLLIETACFRVAQEALTNVVRHARAHAVVVEIRIQHERLHLFVRDDGVGFDVAALREQAVLGASLGLLSMEERAKLADGGLECKSAPGQGTEIHAWFPLKWRTPIP